MSFLLSMRGGHHGARDAGNSTFTNKLQLSTVSVEFSAFHMDLWLYKPVPHSGAPACVNWSFLGSLAGGLRRECVTATTIRTVALSWG